MINQVQKEAMAQQAIIEYCRLRKIKIYAVPNGGKRSAKEAYFLRLEGVSAGICDLCVPYMRGGYGALYIELKMGKNKTTKLQQEWIDYLNSAGYLAVVCYGHRDAISMIEKYLNTN